MQAAGASTRTCVPDQPSGPACRPAVQGPVLCFDMACLLFAHSTVTTLAMMLDAEAGDRHGGAGGAGGDGGGDGGGPASSKCSVCTSTVSFTQTAVVCKGQLLVHAYWNSIYVYTNLTAGFKQAYGSSWRASGGSFLPLVIPLYTMGHHTCRVMHVQPHGSILRNLRGGGWQFLHSRPECAHFCFIKNITRHSTHAHLVDGLVLWLVSTSM